MTQIQLLFDQERKALKPGDTELLKRVIRSEEGTLTGYIKMLEAKLGMEVTSAPVEAVVAEEFKPFVNTMTSSIENTTTLN